MACFSRQFTVSLLVVIINLLRTECVGTRAARKGLIFGEGSNSTRECSRHCRSILKDQEKRTVSTRMIEYDTHLRISDLNRGCGADLNTV